MWAVAHESNQPMQHGLQSTHPLLGSTCKPSTATSSCLRLPRLPRLT